MAHFWAIFCPFFAQILKIYLFFFNLKMFFCSKWNKMDNKKLWGGGRCARLRKLFKQNLFSNIFYFFVQNGQQIKTNKYTLGSLLFPLPSPGTTLPSLVLIILYYSLLFFIILCYSLLLFFIIIIGGDNCIDFVIFLDIFPPLFWMHVFLHKNRGPHDAMLVILIILIIINIHINLY